MRSAATPTDTVPPICAPVEQDASTLLAALRLWRGEASKLAEGSGIALSSVEAATESDDLSGVLADTVALPALYGVLHATAREVERQVEEFRGYAETLRSAADTLGAMLVERSAAVLKDNERRLAALVEARAQELVAVRLAPPDGTLH